MDAVIVYCFVDALTSLKKIWKKLVLSVAAVFLLLLVSGFNLSGQSYTPAYNAQKMPLGTKEVCETIYYSNNCEPCDVMMSSDLFFWVRSYCSSIRVPFIRDLQLWYDENGALDLDTVGKTGAENNCKYVVLSAGEQVTGNLEKYGYSEFTAIPAGDSLYIIYEINAAE